MVLNVTFNYTVNFDQLDVDRQLLKRSTIWLFGRVRSGEAAGGGLAEFYFGSDLCGRVLSVN